MKTVVLHDRYSNEPMVVRPEAIVAIRKVKKIEEEEYSNIIVDTVMIDVKECIGTVITKIKKAEDEGSSE
jgi:hypothetical protein